MVTINLKDFYPWYTHDEFVDVSDEVAGELFADKRYQKAYRRRVYRNKAQYSLDAGDGIENEACYINLTPHEIYERQLMRCRLCCALNSLPETQGRRIDAHYILCMNKAEIARAEGVAVNAVKDAIKRGLKNMEYYLKNNL